MYKKNTKFIRRKKIQMIRKIRVIKFKKRMKKEEKEQMRIKKLIRPVVV